MFARIGRFTVRRRRFLLTGWLLLFISDGRRDT
jgi:hypothetical protein